MKSLKTRLVSAGVLVSFCIFVTANPVPAEVSDTLTPEKTNTPCVTGSPYVSAQMAVPQPRPASLMRILGNTPRPGPGDCHNLRALLPAPRAAHP
jgi:hypothetical protein